VQEVDEEEEEKEVDEEADQENKTVFAET